MFRSRTHQILQLLAVAIIGGSVSASGQAGPASVVLTVTGARTFLGQTLLRPTTPTFEVAIGPDGEALSAAPPPTTGISTFGLAIALTVASIGLVWLIRAIVNRLTSRP